VTAAARTVILRREPHRFTVECLQPTCHSPGRLYTVFRIDQSSINTRTAVSDTLKVEYTVEVRWWQVHYHRREVKIEHPYQKVRIDPMLMPDVEFTVDLLLL
jgi:hypothetical protein